MKRSDLEFFLSLHNDSCFKKTSNVSVLYEGIFSGFYNKSQELLPFYYLERKGMSFSTDTHEQVKLINIFTFLKKQHSEEEIMAVREKCLNYIDSYIDLVKRTFIFFFDNQITINDIDSLDPALHFCLNMDGIDMKRMHPIVVDVLCGNSKTEEGLLLQRIVPNCMLIMDVISVINFEDNHSTLEYYSEVLLEFHSSLHSLLILLRNFKLVITNLFNCIIIKNTNSFTNIMYLNFYTNIFSNLYCRLFYFFYSDEYFKNEDFLNSIEDGATTSDYPARCHRRITPKEIKYYNCSIYMEQCHSYLYKVNKNNQYKKIISEMKLLDDNITLDFLVFGFKSHVEYQDLSNSKFNVYMKNKYFSSNNTLIFDNKEHEKINIIFPYLLNINHVFDIVPLYISMMIDYNVLIGDFFDD